MEEKGGINLYAFTRSDGVNHIDALGLARTKVQGCVGTCGKIIDEWILEEIKLLYNGYIAWRDQAGGNSGITQYQYWRNGNQGYKSEKFIKFNDPQEGCETQPDKSKPGCEPSGTLFGTCAKSSTLGSLVYGLVAQMDGFDEKSTIVEPSRIKRSIAGQIFDQKVALTMRMPTPWDGKWQSACSPPVLAA